MTVKKTNAVEEARTDNEICRPTFYLLGWHTRTERWRPIRTGLVSFRLGDRIVQEGRKGYSKIMMVSQLELRTLGLPLDFEAKDYHSIEGQRRVSKASQGGRNR